MDLQNNLPETQVNEMSEMPVVGTDTYQSSFSNTEKPKNLLKILSFSAVALVVLISFLGGGYYLSKRGNYAQNQEDAQGSQKLSVIGKTNKDLEISTEFIKPRNEYTDWNLAVVRVTNNSNEDKMLTWAGITYTDKDGALIKEEIAVFPPYLKPGMTVVGTTIVGNKDFLPTDFKTNFEWEKTPTEIIKLEADGAPDNLLALENAFNKNKNWSFLISSNEKKDLVVKDVFYILQLLDQKNNPVESTKVESVTFNPGLDKVFSNGKLSGAGWANFILLDSNMNMFSKIKAYAIGIDSTTSRAQYNAHNEAEDKYKN